VKLLFLTQVVDAQDAVLGFVPRWIQGLARHCERVRVVALEAGDVSTLPPNADVRVVGRRGRLRRWLRYRSILDEALAHDRFDVVLAHMVPRYALVAAGPARRSGARVYLWYTHAGVDSRLKRASSIVERVFTASPESLRIDTEKRVVTGHGIDLHHFADREEESEAPPRVLAVGRLTPSKDPLTAVEAVSILVAQGRDLHLDLVGAARTRVDHVYEREVVEKIASNGLADRVVLAGDVPYPEIPRWYARSSVVVNASSTGSLDKVVLEAMAMRRPFVSCNDAVPRVIAGLGAQAPDLLFQRGDARELARKIAALLDMPKAERALLGADLRAIVERDHEVEALMARLCAEMERTETGRSAAGAKDGAP
jgi:glycosyltransferase involved in cell wall biosynthesis